MSGSSQKASLVNFKYHIGLNPIMNYEATPLPDNTIIIRRHNDTCIQVALGDTVPSIGVVGMDANGNVTVGDYTVPTGLSLNKRYVAKPINKDKTEFALLDENGRVRDKYKLGEYTSKGNLVEQDEFGNLKIGEGSIKVLPILMKVSFQILSEIPREEADKFGLYKANRAVFNVYNGKDLTAGTPTFGYFIPRGRYTKGKKLGEFKEVVEGELVTTAEMYPAGNNPNIASIRVRRPDVAYEAATLFQEKIEIQNALKGLQDKSIIERANGNSPAKLSHDLSSRLKQKLDVIESDLDKLAKEWESSELYTVNTGKDYLKKISPKEKDNSREPK
tara:strand:+ start:171 stop:1166 length:996 start_codon:yes stop_codon:yes gene_type:complete